MTPRLKRSFLAAVALLVFSLSWNALVHLLVLAELNASLQHLRRTDLALPLWLPVLLAAATVALFVFGYIRFARSGSLGEGALYGAWFGALAVLFVDVNQYLLYPLPVRAPAAWAIAGLVEFTLSGLLLSRLCPPLLDTTRPPSP